MTDRLIILLLVVLVVTQHVLNVWTLRRFKALVSEFAAAVGKAL